MESAPQFRVGQHVRVRPEFRQEGDFEDAVIWDVGEVDRTVDVAVDGVDWGQWFIPLPDGSYEIEPILPAVEELGQPAPPE